MTSPEWRINRREECCTTCGRPFGEGETFFSLLFLDPDRLRRADLCAACFAVPPAGAAVFWRTRRRPERRSRLSVDFEAIEELFLALEGRSEERLRELRYLLALLLLRKKRLKLVGVRRHDAGETMCLRRPRRAEEFEVLVHELDSERAQALKAELARIFEGAGVEALLQSPLPASGQPAGSEAPSGDPRG